MIASNDTFLKLRKTIETLSIKDNSTQNMALDRLFLSYEYPGLEKREVKDLLLLLWKIDTLSDSSTWSLFQSNGIYFLRKIKLQNRNLYHLLEPDTFGSEKYITNENALKLINSLPTSVPELDESKELIIDGIKCGIISSNINVEWWHKTSQTISPIESWIIDTVGKFDSFI